jgi:hypothetical protein
MLLQLPYHPLPQSVRTRRKRNTVLARHSPTSHGTVPTNSTRQPNLPPAALQDSPIIPTQSLTPCYPRPTCCTTVASAEQIFTANKDMSHSILTGSRPLQPSNLARRDQRRGEATDDPAVLGKAGSPAPEFRCWFGVGGVSPTLTSPHHHISSRLISCAQSAICIHRSAHRPPSPHDIITHAAPKIGRHPCSAIAAALALHMRPRSASRHSFLARWPSES